MSFKNSLKQGESGEHAVWNALNNVLGTRSVVDVRKDRRFQEQDVDFLVEDFWRQFTSVEVKTDYQAHETGNIVYELTTGGHIGCFEKTKADYIAYFIPGDEVIYIISTYLLRQYIRNLKQEPVPMGDSASGYLIPIADLLKSRVIKETYKGVC